MTRQHTYVHLDDTSLLDISLEMRKVAENIAEMNYGVHRFLSHLVDIRLQKHNENIEMYIERGDDDIAKLLKIEGDKLANGILKLLNSGLT